MERHFNDLTTDEQIDAALERARNAPPDITIVEASYRPEPGLEFLMLKLSDGRRLLVPREELGELKNATPQQAADRFARKREVRSRDSLKYFLSTAD